ncbi:class I SAM-dependent methyltransferase [Aerococcaceae bacterium zg-ZJ1578]|uniref:class I SAM-dependent methyltransferase n=1 Tax=Aerococcaceae bacterium zg-252 TaxID=2796928 RepID=UPI001A2D2CE0|nr:class I SAM-dependent methyltransferase [Aerococcaceae bacterium zg-1578]
MSKQYFMNQPEVAHQQREIVYEVAPYRLKLTTDNGVFSKNQVDYGSNVLVETLLAELNSASAEVIVELGSGYGPIALMLAKQLPNAVVTGIEINERAYHLAQQNAQRNGIENCQFINGDAITALLEVQPTVVVTNPPIRAGKAVVHGFIERAAQLLSDDGVLYVVIQKKQGAPSAEKLMRQLFSEVEKVTQDKGYWILRGVK